MHRSSLIGRGFTLAIVGLLAAALTSLAWAQTTFTPQEEQKAGKEVVAEVLKQYKVYKDPDAVKKIETIISNIEPYSQRPNVKYDVILLDSSEVNAFSVPGGYIFVTKGLLNAVQSTDELAGVIAHEMAHNCHYDALVQANRSQKMFMGALGATLAAIILGGSSNVVATTAEAGLYVRQGYLSRYSIEIEARADHDGCMYLAKSGKYNPVGMLTFMERLARQERRDMPADPGVFEDHPPSTERVTLLMDELTSLGIKINRRAVTKWRKPEVKEVEVKGQDGKDAKWPAVSWWDRTIFTVVGPDEAKAKERADAINQRLTEALAKGAQQYDFTTAQDGDTAALDVSGAPLFTATAADATAQGKTQDQLAKDALKSVSAALMQERFAYEL